MPTAPRRRSTRKRTTSSTFLTYIANPEMEERKRMGVKVVLFLLLLTGLTYAVKRKLWADVDH